MLKSSTHINSVKSQQIQLSLVLKNLPMLVFFFFTNQQQVGHMKHHTYIKFKSVFSKSKRPLVSRSKRKRGSVGSSFSVCVSIYCIYRRVALRFPLRMSFLSVSPWNSQALHRALGFECVSSATTRGQASISGGALALKGRRVQRKLPVNAPAMARICFPNGKIQAGMSRFAFCIPFISDRSFGSPFLWFSISSLPVSF